MISRRASSARARWARVRFSVVGLRCAFVIAATALKARCAWAMPWVTKADGLVMAASIGRAGFRLDKVGERGRQRAVGAHAVEVYTIKINSI